MPLVMKVMKAKAVKALAATKKKVFKSPLPMKSATKQAKAAAGGAMNKAMKKNLKKDLKNTMKKDLKKDLKKTIKTAMNKLAGGKPNRLTAKSLTDHVHGNGTMTLDNKMELYRAGTIDKESFNQEDRHKLWDRYHKQLVHSPEDQASFKSIQGPGCQEKKNACLFAWVKDPTWGKKYRSLTKEVTKQFTMGRKTTLITYKQLCDKYGKEHADSLINRELVEKRQDKRNKDIWWFVDHEDYMHHTFNKATKLKAGQGLDDARGKDDRKEWKKFAKGLTKMSHDDIEVNDDDISDNNDDEDETQLPPSLAKLMGQKKEKKKKANLAIGDDKSSSGQGSQGNKSPSKSPSKGAKNEAVYEDCLASLAGDDKKTVLSRASKMHTMLLQVVTNTKGEMKNDIKKVSAEISDKVADQKSAGMVKLLQRAAKLWKKAKTDSTPK